jgi:hypothetical protein
MTTWKETMPKTHRKAASGPSEVPQEVSHTDTTIAGTLLGLPRITNSIHTILIQHYIDQRQSLLLLLQRTISLEKGSLMG